MQLNKGTIEHCEMGIYRCLGVKQFRKAVLLLEKILHRKDQGYNINYHIAAFSLEEAVAFIKYLFYNGAIHFRNIVVLAIYLYVSKMLFSQDIKWYDTIFLILGVKDLYCITLQRYNYLYLNRKIEIMSKLRKRKLERQIAALHAAANNHSPTISKIDIEFIDKLKKAILTGSDLLITTDDMEALHRFYELLNPPKQ